MSATSELIERYLLRRRVLLEARTPLEGWTVYISPADAERIREEQAQNSDPIVFQGRFMGADWHIDATVEPGELRIETKERT